MKERSLFANIILISLVGCAGGNADKDCQIGSELCSCDLDGECDEGLVCESNECVQTTEDTISTEIEGTENTTDLDTDSLEDTETEDTEEGIDTSTIGEYDSDVDTSDGLACANNNGRYDEESKLCWQYPKLPGEYSWKEAISYCEELSLGGYDDWVLPEKQNFVDLLGDCELVEGAGDINLLLCNSCYDSDKCRRLFGKDTEWYWSSDKTPEDCDAGWACGFGSGEIGGDCRPLSGIRCVRNDEI